MSDNKLQDLTGFLLGIKPKGPPIPRKEIVQLLKRLRFGIDKLIVKLEKGDKAAKTARKAPAKKTARKRTR